MNPPQEKILLGLMPYWDPQIPPLGLACLKSFLQRHGLGVKSVDLNVEVGFRTLHDEYFAILQESIPAERQGNLLNIGNQVLRHHLMAHLRGKDGDRYPELVKILIDRTFYWPVPGSVVASLDRVIHRFYKMLEESVLALLERENPTVLGLSVYGDTFAAALAAFGLAKRQNPAIKTVMGGGIFADQLAPGSPDLDFFLREAAKDVDALIVGEGEMLLLKWLRGELDPARKIYGLDDIEGQTLDLSLVDVPDFSDFDLSFYPHLALYGARSCPHQCKFCSETVNWGRYRKKEVQRLVDEFAALQRLHSRQLFLLTDSSLNPIITALAEAVIRSGRSIYWDGFLRADRPVGRSDHTLLWRKGGFYRAKLGLESGSPRLLQSMNKGISVAQSEAALASLAYAGIKTTTFWLFGFPGETEQDFQMTLDFVERFQDHIYEADANVFNYYPAGQVNSSGWQKNRKMLLYPSWSRQILITPTWVLAVEPQRQTAYDRLNRFIRHCNRLGIPNPYSLNDVYKADLRWKKLHKNAVPSVVDLNNTGATVDESRSVREYQFAQTTLRDDDEWL